MERLETEILATLGIADPYVTCLNRDGMTQAGETDSASALLQPAPDGGAENRRTGWLAGAESAARACPARRRCARRSRTRSRSGGGPGLLGRRARDAAAHPALRRARVDDVMVPRADIIAVDENEPIRELLKTFDAAGVSRMPLFRETLDDPRGMVHVKDLLRWLIGDALGRPASEGHVPPSAHARRPAGCRRACAGSRARQTCPSPSPRPSCAGP